MTFESLALQLQVQDKDLTKIQGNKKVTEVERGSILFLRIWEPSLPCPPHNSILFCCWFGVAWFGPTMLRNLHDLDSTTQGSDPGPPATEVQSLNHRTAREVLVLLLFIWLRCHSQGLTDLLTYAHSQTPYPC